MTLLVLLSVAIGAGAPSSYQLGFEAMGHFPSARYRDGDAQPFGWLRRKQMFQDAMNLSVACARAQDCWLATGARQAWHWNGERFTAGGPDVVVLDLKMPEMDGVTVLQQIRSLNFDQPVIILTGAATPEMEQQVRALGVTEFVEKEFSFHHLGDALNRVLAASPSATLTSL